MALTRKFLKAMGIDDEKIDQIIDAHTETVDGLKDKIAEFEESAKKLPSVQQELDALKAEKKDGNPFEKKYNDLKEKYDTFKSEVESKETHSKKEKAYRELLREAGISDKRIDTVIKVSDIDGLKISADGKIEDAETKLNGIKSEWADFIVKASEVGANPANPPQNTGKGLTKADLYKRDEHGRYIMDTAARQKALAENPDLMKQ